MQTSAYATVNIKGFCFWCWPSDENNIISHGFLVTAMRNSPNNDDVRGNFEYPKIPSFVALNHLKTDISILLF